MKNKNLIIFIVIGFIVTTAIWGFVGGCGRSYISLGSKPAVLGTEEPSAEGVILDKTSISVEGQTYIVEPGDTLWGISKKFGISVSSIKEANKLQTDTISVGQRLVLPGVVEVEEEEREVERGQTSQETRGQTSQPKPGLAVYKVRQNDSLWRIAQIYGTTIERIAELNGLPKNAKLTPGQEILVPSD